MKITHVFHHFAPCTGGIETVIMQLSKQLQKKHFSKVVCLNKCPKAKEKFPAQETIEGIEVQRIPFIDLKFYKFAPLVAMHLKDADIIHVHGINFFSDFLAITKPLHKKKMVLSTHGGIFHTNKKSIFKKIYFFGWCKLALKAFEKIICVSKNDFKLFSKIAPKEKLVLIENGIEFEKFNSSSVEKKTNSFVFVGRISKNKRIDLLIECFARLNGKIDFELNIVGMDFDKLMGWLETRTGMLGIKKQVIFHGAVNEKKLLDTIGKAEFFVSASEYEGFGLTALEAMAAHCIPILNSIDSFRNFLQEGKNGFIVEFAKSSETAQKIIEITKIAPEKKEEIIMNAVARAKEFAWAKKALEYEKVYSEIKMEQEMQKIIEAKKREKTKQEMQNIIKTLENEKTQLELKAKEGIQQITESKKIGKIKQETQNIIQPIIKIQTGETKNEMQNIMQPIIETKTEQETKNIIKIEKKENKKAKKSKKQKRAVAKKSKNQRQSKTKKAKR